MKKLILSLLFITLSVVLAQAQTALYSLYMFNPYILNPGVAGISNHVEIAAGYRNQWVNFEGAPTTYYLTVHAPLDKRSARYGKKDFNHSAVGGMLFADQYGQLMELGGSGSYTLHIALNKQYKLSMGGAIGFRQYSFDKAKMTTSDPSDNILNNLKNKYTFDGTFGGWLYGKNLYLGVSGTNLLSFSNFAYNNCFAMGGYRYQANSRLEVLPSVLARLSPTVDPQFDFNCKLRYDKMIWGGASFRTNRTFVLMGGFKWNNTLSVGYAYDTPWNYVKNFQSASHEIFVQFELRNHKVICPEFW